MDKRSWNTIGREKNARVCTAFEAIIDRDERADEDLEEDTRSEELANEVLEEVVALNAAGKWRDARAAFDPAFLPFIPHMEQTDQGLTAVTILGPNAFLVRRGDDTQDGPVLHIEGDSVNVLPDTTGFGISRNRSWLVLATEKGLVVSRGFGGKDARTIVWPDRDVIRPATLGISDDGHNVLIANDAGGVWLARGSAWTKLLPRDGVGNDEQPDIVHAAISPNGQYVAYGWQDAPGHYVDDVSKPSIERVGVIGTVRDTPYHVLFTDDSKSIVSNTRYMQSGVTVCVAIDAIRGIQAYGEVPASATRADEYLRAYGVTLLPGAPFEKKERIAWIGGQGWSHAAPLSGGKPIFTHLLGSTLNAFDFDPETRRVAVASGSSVLHVLDPFVIAEPGRERGYKPRRELYRWIFWDTLKSPIRW